MIEAAYAQRVLPVWTEDEAGPYPTLPYPGVHWQLIADPLRYPHEYVRAGTAKQLTLFHPASGAVRVKGVRSCTNAVLHPWLEAELHTILAMLPEPTETVAYARESVLLGALAGGPLSPHHLAGGLAAAADVAGSGQPHRPSHPVVRALVVRPRGDAPVHAAGRQLAQSAQRAPAESIQRILKRRALDGHHPQTPQEIIGWLEATAEGWNRAPTPFVWGGKRQARRARARQRRHALGGSGACTKLPLHWEQAA